MNGIRDYICGSDQCSSDEWQKKDAENKAKTESIISYIIGLNCETKFLLKSCFAVQSNNIFGCTRKDINQWHITTRTKCWKMNVGQLAMLLL